MSVLNLKKRRDKLQERNNGDDIGRTFGGLSISAKLLIGHSVLFLVAIVIIGGLTYWQASRTIEQDLSNHMENSTRIITGMIKSSADMVINSYLRAIANSNRDIVSSFYRQYQSGQITEKEAMLKARSVLVSQRIGKTGYIYCLDSTGFVTVHGNPGVENHSVSSFGFVQKQMRMKNGFITYRWKNPGEPVAREKALYMVYFEPWDWIISATSYRSEFMDLLNLEDIRQMVLGQRLGESGYCFVLNGEGDYVVHPVLEGNIRDLKNPAMKKTARKIIEQKKGRLEYEWQNKGEPAPRKKNVTLNYIKEFDWVVGSSIYVDEYFQPLYRIGKTIGVIFLIVFVMVMFFSVWVSRIISAPIGELIGCFTKVASGDFSTRVKVPSGDEIGALSHSFNSMTIQLQTALDDLTLFKSAVENSSDAIGMSTPEGVHWYQNRAFDELFGQVGPNPAESLYVSSDVGHTVFKTIMGGDSWAGEVEMYSPDNDILFIKLRAFSLKGENGKVIALVGVHSDITQQKETEISLVKSERNYREIFNATSDAIFIHDGMSGNILDVNQPMLSMYGYEKHEVIGVHAGKFGSGVSPYDEKGVEEEIKKAVDGGNHIHEWQARKKNGEIFWVEVNLRLSSIGNEKRILAVVRDITERKRSYEVLIQSEKMMSLGGLAAGMAHEINNPLAGLLQTAEVMTNRLTHLDLPANVRTAEELGVSMDAIRGFISKRGIPKMLQAIQASGNRMASIVNNMLDFARKGDAGVSAHRLSDLLDNALELATTDYDLKKHYDFRKIRVIKDYEEGMPMVSCQESKMQQVLLNILRNGAQAMHPETDSPEFLLKTGIDMKNKMAWMTIGDNGPGMDEETCKRIFEPFFTTKPVGVGTGLGLSVSYFIITETHGGQLTVDSAPGAGATFTIRMPIDEEVESEN